MQFARRLIDLMLFRAGPQDMPGTQNTLIASGIAYCIALFAQVVMIAPPGAALIQSVLATVLLAIYTSAVLRVRKLPNRFLQTTTALFSVSAVLTLIMIAPTQALAPYIEQLGRASDPQAVPTPPGGMMLIYLVAGFWSLALYSHIYRHALSASILLGVGATITFELLVLVVFSLLG